MIDGKANFDDILKRLLLNWIVCMGSITLLVLLGYVVSCMFMPVASFALILPIVVYGNYTLGRHRLHCSLLTHYTVFTLFVSTVVMLIINLVNNDWVSWGFAQSWKSDIPFVPVLVVYTVAAIEFGIACLRRGHTEYCRACKLQVEHSVIESIERNVLHREATYQIRVAFFISLAICVCSWLYYAFMYKNVNINPADTFFFFICPTVVFVLSWFSFAQRYSTQKFEISMNYNRYKRGDSVLRFIVVRGDKILLEEAVRTDNGIGIWDTPAVADINFSTSVSEAKAMEMFRSLSGTDHFRLKPLFQTTNKVNNAFHYAVFVDDDQSLPLLKGEWLDLYQINTMLSAGLIARTFGYEIHRIFTITMAWKTYDREGHRRYPIKNYRPTFRLSDFKDWTVDYSDLHWMSVARNNEDKPMFRFLRFWRQHVSGVDTRWKRKD